MQDLLKSMDVSYSDSDTDESHASSPDVSSDESDSQKNQHKKNSFISKFKCKSSQIS